MKHYLRVFPGLLSVCLLLAHNPAWAATAVVPKSKGVNLTVYNDDLGLVKDLREIELKEGVNYLRFEDVAAKIDPTSVSFQSLTDAKAVIVTEQNYQYDLIDPSNILAKSIGKEIKVLQFLPGGATHQLSGILLNAPSINSTDPNYNSASAGSNGSNGIVVKTATGVVLNPVGEMELAELPKGLISKPSLFWKLQCKKAGQHLTQVSYQTSDMSWSCDYIAVLNEDDNQADLTSWVTLINRSGASFNDACLKLVAGDVHRVQTPKARVAGVMMAQRTEAEPQFQEQSFAEYHLYSLAGKTDVNNNETKQLNLFAAFDVPIRKRFVFEASTPYYYGGMPKDSNKVNVKLEVDNSEANHLGMPLPKGKVRVYKKDKDGALQFVGEDSIDHTACDEKVRIYIGDAFDVVGERKLINTQQVSNKARRESYQISFRNHKKVEISIVDIEHAWGDWKILSSSAPYIKKDSHTFEFSQNVPVGGEATISYEIETRF